MSGHSKEFLQDVEKHIIGVKENTVKSIPLAGYSATFMADGAEHTLVLLMDNVGDVNMDNLRKHMLSTVQVRLFGDGYDVDGETTMERFFATVSVSLLEPVPTLAERREVKILASDLSWTPYTAAIAALGFQSTMMCAGGDDTVGVMLMGILFTVPWEILRESV
jgi:hypothetical protein